MSTRYDYKHRAYTPPARATVRDWLDAIAQATVFAAFIVAVSILVLML